MLIVQLRFIHWVAWTVTCVRNAIDRIAPSFSPYEAAAGQGPNPTRQYQPRPRQAQHP
jgi:mannitol-1-phosphate/altronate dehydrogenase